ncbi:MAG: hypothetical protein AAF519_11270 [Bacteroidota bacterium]
MKVSRIIAVKFIKFYRLEIGTSALGFVIKMGKLIILMERKRDDDKGRIHV